MARRQSHSRSSCLSTNAKLSSGRTIRTSAQQPTRLVVFDVGDPREQLSLFNALLLQVLLDKSWVTDWCAQHFDPLFLGKQKRVTLLVIASMPSGTSPHLGLALVQIDTCVTLELLGQNCQNIGNSVGCANTCTSSKNANNFSLSRSLLCTALKARCCPRANNIGTKGSPCSPPSPCGISQCLH